MQRPKKNSYKEFDNEKKFLRPENSLPLPPHNFSNGPSQKPIFEIIRTLSFCGPSEMTSAFSPTATGGGANSD